MSNPYESLEKFIDLIKKDKAFNTGDTYKLVDQFLEKASGEEKYAGFTIPIQKGEIYLATRKTHPFPGLYSVIGGKVEKLQENAANAASYIELNIGNRSSASERLKERGFEMPSDAALREFFEEMFSLKTPPSYFSKEQFLFKRLGCFSDINMAVSCYVRLLELPDDLQFNPSQRELGEVSKVSALSQEQINPLTRIVLEVIKKYDSLSKYHSQIPEISLDDLEINWFCGGDELTYLFKY